MMADGGSPISRSLSDPIVDENGEDEVGIVIVR